MYALKDSTKTSLNEKCGIVLLTVKSPKMSSLTGSFILPPASVFNILKFLFSV
jgi:hypothetical protein